MKNFVEIVKEYDYYDTHTHINSKPLLDTAEQIIEDCKNQKILINAIGTGAEDSLVGFKQAQKYTNVFCTVGFHHEEIKNHTPEECKNLIDEILKLNDGSIIAIGEVGLDYTYDLDKNIQKQVFIKMIELAKKYHLPLELHIRDAHEDAITILNEHAKGITKIVHCFSASAEIPCMTGFIGGVVCQEIIKTTGKFRPIDQWEIFDFLQYSSIIPEEEKFSLNISNNELSKTRYYELISIFGDKIVSKLQNLNIFLAGAGALGCELLKNLSLFGISGSILVIDDDNIEISNLNRQFLFHEEHKGKSKAYIACKSAKEINNDLQCNYISKRISPDNKNIFNKTYFNKVDFVLGAIDSNQGNYYLVKQCELFDKIFIKGGTGGPAGKIESFIPQITCSYNNIKYIGAEEEKSPSCTRREFPGKIEDCIDNARDLFDEYFVTLINDLLKLINGNEKLLKLEVENEKRL